MRKTGRKFSATIHVVPCLITVLISVNIFHTSNTVSFLVRNVTKMIQDYNVSSRFINTLPATLVGPLDNDKTHKLVISTVDACKTSSFINHLTYVFRKSASAAFCVLTICFKDIDIAHAERTLDYKLVTSFTKVLTTVFVKCLFFG